MRSEFVDRDYKSLVPIVLGKLFPSVTEKAEAKKILYSYRANEPDRVRLGILKVSNGDLEEMKRQTSVAKLDWRDLLCNAEYPLTSRRWGLKEKNPAKYEKYLEKEQNEYDEWLATVLAT